MTMLQDSLMPCIEINTVGLESVANWDAANTARKDPHIQREKAISYEQEEALKRAWASMSPETWGLSGLGGQGSSWTNQGTLKVHLKLSVKEEEDNLWLFDTSYGPGSQLDILNYIHVKIIRSTLPKNNSVMKALLPGPAMTTPLYWVFGKYVPGHSPSSHEQSLQQHYEKQLGQNIIEHDLTLSDLLGKGYITKSVTHSYDKSGNRVKNYFFDYIDNVDSNPKDLTYFIVSYIKLPEDALGAPLNDAGHVYAEYANCTHQTIIENYKTASKTIVFRDSDGNQHHGMVHQMADGRWMTGTNSGHSKQDVELGRVKYLTRSVENNINIQDFRLTKAVNNIAKDFASTFIKNEFVNKSKNLQFYADIKDISFKNSLTTELFMSRGRFGQCSGLFGIHFQRVLEENSAFPGLYKNPTIASELLSLASIKKLSIKRRRVKEINSINKLGGNITGHVSYNNENPLLIVQVEDEDLKFGHYVKDQFGSVKATKVGDVTGGGWTGLMERVELTGLGTVTYVTKEETKFVTDDQAEIDPETGEVKATEGNEITTTVTEKTLEPEESLRFYSFSDWDLGKTKDMKAGQGQFPKHTGQYQYKVEVELIDNTVVYIQSKIKKLESAVTSLEAYLHEASRQSFQQHVLDPSGKLQASSVMGNYDSTTGKFSNAFISRWEEPENRQIRNNALKDYVEIFDALSTKSMNFFKAYIPYFQILIHPRTGSPEGIKIVIDLISDLIRKVETTMGKSITRLTTYSRDEKTNSSKQNKAAKRNIKFEKWFSSVFDASVPRGVGYEYLNAHGPIEKASWGRGLRKMPRYTTKGYINRTMKEFEKYFQINKSGQLEQDSTISAAKIKQLKLQSIFEEDFLRKNLFSYLSPSSVSVRSFTESEIHNGTPGGKEDDGYVSFLEKGDQLFLDPKQREIIAKIVRFNSLRRSPQVPLLKIKINPHSSMNTQEQVLSSQLTPLFAEMSNITARPLRVTTKNMENMKSIFVDAETVMGSGSLFISGSFRKERFANEGKDRLEEEAMASTIPLYRHLLKNQIFGYEHENLAGIKKKEKIPRSPHNMTVHNFDINSTNHFLHHMSEKDIASLPLQLKSFLVNSVSPTAVVHDWFKAKLFEASPEGSLGTAALGNQPHVESLTDPMAGYDLAGAFYINYMKLMEVQVLQGFDKSSTGELLLNRPNWRTLKESEDWSDKEGAKTLICRLKPYYHSELRIRPSKKMELPTIDEYFIIEPSTSESAQAAVKKELESKSDAIIQAFEIDLKAQLGYLKAVEAAAAKNQQTGTEQTFEEAGGKSDKGTMGTGGYE